MPFRFSPSLIVALLFSLLLATVVNSATLPRTPDPRHLAPRVGEAPATPKRAPGAIPANEASIQQSPQARALEDRAPNRVEDLGKRVERQGAATWSKTV